MSDVDELYQELVLDHSKHPRNYGALEGGCISARGANPMCGDHLVLDVRVEEGRVKEVRFRGDGCAISRASASLMTEAVQDLTLEQAQALFSKMHQLFTTGEVGCPLEALGKLGVLAGVWEYPSRVKCASLAWHTLRSAITTAEEAR